jgi:hypothetical protein
MRTITAVAVAVAALALAGAAVAGGWATVQLSSTPTGLGPGDKWNLDVTVLQHGQTALAGVEPTITIRSDSGEKQTFAATPTGKTGVYHADVVFPTAGTWTYEVYDGFDTYGGAQTHTFAPVEIGAPAAASPAAPAEPTASPAVAADDGGGFPLWPVLAGLVGAVAAAAVAIVAWRSRPKAPAPTH